MFRNAGRRATIQGRDYDREAPLSPSAQKRASCLRAVRRATPNNYENPAGGLLEVEDAMTPPRIDGARSA